ncbi:MAG: 2-dehydropantoate 2-reductase [Oscillospiraceae bacterium]|nr:2-dehydropantoate 2-reductase [Oscillospiraceae bacterium]
MKIYIDFDDIICETARFFSVLAEKMLGIHVPYEEIEYFDLRKAFGLNEEDYNALMVKGHSDEDLLALEETPGASETINSWIDAGHEVFIMTGRPASVYETSLRWLNEHKLSGIRLICCDKYGRDAFLKNSSFTISLDDFYAMEFDFIIEDSPEAFKHLAAFPGARVAVLDRPWNHSCLLPEERYTRCRNWKEIDTLLRSL